MILFWHTGQPFEALNGWTNANGSAQINLPTVTTDRPSMVAGQSYKAAHASLTNWLNLNAFTPQPAGTPGNEASYQFFGPHTRRADLSIFKNFELHEKMTLQFRARSTTSSTRQTLALPIRALAGGRKVRNMVIYTRLRRETIRTSAALRPRVVLRLACCRETRPRCWRFWHCDIDVPNINPRQFQFAMKLLF